MSSEGKHLGYIATKQVALNMLTMR
uniref:Uncharacterized protein n=1 Tax=Arundo donax TaxID=35708 RepID=A0A0A8Z7T0_ARUDO